jgi:hypothetical protein
MTASDSTESIEAQVRRYLAQARQHFNRAKRARIGSNERRKQLAEFRQIMAVVLGIVGDAQLDPELIPRWAHEAFYR